MTESELRRRFEDLTLAPSDFSHRDHVRLAWHYLGEFPLLDVLRIFPGNLKRFANSIGATNLYHETVTWAFLVIIHERIRRSGRCDSFERFADANEELFAPSFLNRWYDAAVLDSQLAREVFLFPAAHRP